MQFDIPTSKAQMYATLQDIFYFYRVRREEFENVELVDLELPRLEVELPTDSQITANATILLSAKQEQQIKDYQQQLNLQILEIQTKINLINQNASSQITQVNDLYDQSLEKIRRQVANSGLVNSTVIIDKTTQLEQSKNEQIAKINADKNSEVASLTAKKTALENQLASSSTYFDTIHNKEKQAKVIELKEQKEELSREVFKYNNSLEEKEQRYANKIKETRCSLYLRFLDIKSVDLTHDELIEMGYYEDVIRCVCGYYDTLDSGTAYYDIVEERKLAIYLDEFFTEIVYTYKLRAGA